jgi:RimJ/RimL family protein N-acetyltransferase
MYDAIPSDSTVIEPERQSAVQSTPALRVRPLRNGDTATILARFDRLSDRSRRARFNGPKPRLRDEELQLLAAINRQHHALVAYLVDDPDPVGIARLARNGRFAEIAFAVADEHQRRGIATMLARELARHARAAGIVELSALIASDNRPAIKVLCRIATTMDIRRQGSELDVRAAIA